MYYPLVGDRVWVSGCRDEFIVLSADDATRVATVITRPCSEAVQRCVSFRLLFSHQDFEAAQDDPAAAPVVRAVLRSSRSCMLQARVFMADLRESVCATLAAIRQSQALIAESDRVIERAQNLDCKFAQDESKLERAVAEAGSLRERPI